jgi:cyclic pyranopterin phosphate synthase
MPFEGNSWNSKKILSYWEMKDRLSSKYPGFSRVSDSINGETSKVYQIPGYRGRIGFISSMSNHFCGSCNRIRLTADGKLKVPGLSCFVDVEGVLVWN